MLCSIFATLLSTQREVLSIISSLFVSLANGGRMEMIMFVLSEKEIVTKGLVSIIIPAYQAEAFIERSTQSALNQTYKDVEVIVVENGSSDRTLDVIQNIHNDKLLILHSDKGVSKARNMGIDNCKGEFLLFLDADDWLEKDAIESMISVVDEDVALVSARYFGDKPFERYDRFKYEKGSEDYLIKCLCTPTKRGNCTGNLYRTEFIREHRLKFDPNLTHAEDSVFFFKLLINKPIVVDLEKSVYHVFNNPESVTRTAERDNSDEFCKSISEVYITLSECNSNIVNAGYIFALNQLLVILVNSNKGFFKLYEFIKLSFQRDVFVEAINKVNISIVGGVMRIVFASMKQRMYLLLAIMVKIRSILNAWRRKKQING